MFRDDIDRLDEVLVEDDMTTRRNFPNASTSKCTPQIAFFILVALASVVVVTVFVTKAYEGSSPVPDNDVNTTPFTGGNTSAANLTLVERTINFNNNSVNDTNDRISESNLVKGSCNQSANFIEMALNITKSFVIDECENYPSKLFLNSSLRCYQFFAAKLIAATQAACKLGLNGYYYGVGNFVANQTTGDAKLYEREFRIDQLTSPRN